MSHLKAAVFDWAGTTIDFAASLRKAFFSEHLLGWRTPISRWWRLFTRVNGTHIMADAISGFPPKRSSQRSITSGLTM
jgi:beta-phosphoglucomutase-like phosphatase (HAD superfamily)